MISIRAGFMPLIDAAPLIVAARAGFASAEGLVLDLERESSWATLRDRIAVKRLDVSHMLAPMPIAANLGLTPLPQRLIAPIALGSGGNTITVSNDLWAQLRTAGATADFDAGRSARAFSAVVREREENRQRPLVVAVVHSHSAHRYQLAYWLASAGVDPIRDVELVVVPPAATDEALASGRIDAFCAGEPWGSVAVAAGSGVILTTNAHIWRSCPEKVLGVHAAWASENPGPMAGLIRAIYRASVWCDEPANRDELARLLAASDGLALPAEIIARSLRRRLTSASGEALPVDGFLSFAERSGTFPWISHALWFHAQMVRWGDAVMASEGIATAHSTYRPDLYRAALAPLGVPLPLASSKVEGRLVAPTVVAATVGEMTLGPDTFFDGGTFDPDRA